MLNCLSDSEIPLLVRARSESDLILAVLTLTPDPLGQSVARPPVPPAREQTPTPTLEV
jgi:hypothetical protein